MQIFSSREHDGNGLRKSYRVFVFENDDDPGKQLGTYYRDVGEKYWHIPDKDLDGNDTIEDVATQKDAEDWLVKWRYAGVKEPIKREPRKKASGNREVIDQVGGAT